MTVGAKQRVAGLMLAKHKQTPRFHLPQVWRATRTHCVTIYGPERNFEESFQDLRRYTDGILMVEYCEDILRNVSGVVSV